MGPRQTYAPRYWMARIAGWESGHPPQESDIFGVEAGGNEPSGDAGELGTEVTRDAHGDEEKKFWILDFGFWIGR